MSNETLEYEVPWPFLPPKSTELLMSHFDETVYKVDPSSHLYRFVEALTGDSGAGDLKKKYLVARLSGSADGNNFFDLDSLFNSLLNIPRLDDEVYKYNPFTDLLTSDEWDEVQVKDSWYRSRALEFLQACQAGGTIEGFKRMVSAVTGGTCDVYESWRFPRQIVGRSLYPSTNEVIIRPHKGELYEKEKQTLLSHLDRIKPSDVVITIDPLGVAVHKLIKYRQVGADSSYFEIQKTVTNVVDLSKIPAPEYLAEEIYRGEMWLEEGGTAPSSAFNSSQEYSYYHRLTTSSGDGQIDSISYSTELEQVSKPENDFVKTEKSPGWTSWISYPKADSPDNYPGGRDGQTPYKAPALTKDGEPYVFPYTSQEEFKTEMRSYVSSKKGESNSQQYRLPLSIENTTRVAFPATLVVPSTNPLTGVKVATPYFDNRVSATGTNSYGRE